jgi:hypothetical protein
MSPATCTDPGTHTRPRSLRSRSTIIRFSARSFSLPAAQGVRVSVCFVCVWGGGGQGEGGERGGRGTGSTRMGAVSGAEGPGSAAALNQESF